jgi:hypothetical protein
MHAHSVTVPTSGPLSLHELLTACMVHALPGIWYPACRVPRSGNSANFMGNPVFSVARNKAQILPFWNETVGADM